jgi:hypothetical protein
MALSDAIGSGLDLTIALRDRLRVDPHLGDDPLATTSELPPTSDRSLRCNI